MMGAFLLSALGIGKALLSWLSKRSLAEIACIILGLACLVLVIGNRAEKRHSAKLQAQVVSLNAELTEAINREERSASHYPRPDQGGD
jgi:hypothetical protein